MTPWGAKGAVPFSRCCEKGTVPFALPAGGMVTRRCVTMCLKRRLARHCNPPRRATPQAYG